MKLNQSTLLKLALVCGIALLVFDIFRAERIVHSDLAVEQKDASRKTMIVEQRTVRFGLAGESVAPFIVADTTTDSPGTNLETRVVTFMALIQGTPRPACQWKVNKGGGFLPVSANATNSTLVITNARVSDTGHYALFAQNDVGVTNTTPIELVIVRGED